MVDKLLGGLFGGDDNDDDTRRRARARDFVSRYETGAPDEGYSDEEAVHNYRNATSRLSPEEYEGAATEAFGRLSREERRRLKRTMNERAGGRFDAEGDDPRDLARMTSRFREEESGGGGLASLFGFGGGDKGGGDLVSAAKGDQGGGLLDSTLGKIVLGGIAAVTVKKMLDR